MLLLTLEEGGLGALAYSKGGFRCEVLLALGEGGGRITAFGEVCV